MRRIVVLLATLLALAMVQRSALAQTGSFEGTFTAAAQEQPRIDQAIESAVAKMSFVARPIARGRLKKTNTAYQTIRIAQASSHVSVQLDERKALQMPLDGRAVQWTREDGERFEVSANVQAGVLTQTFKAEDGQRVNRFALSPDGATLTLEVTLTSPRLPTPLKYSLTFNRQLDRKNPHFEFTGNDR
jgi:hypothetical protein